MDIRYHTALRNATNAWAQNRMADTVPMQDHNNTTPAKPLPAPAPVSPHCSSLNWHAMAIWEPV